MSTNSINKISKLFNYNAATDSIITLGAGCYWGVEHHYRKHFQDKLKHVVVGFANGNDSFKTSEDGITYKRVTGGDTGFAEVVQIQYNKSDVSLDELLDFFFRLHDPTTKNRQGGDIGTQYRSGIFASNEEDLRIALASKEKWQPKWNNDITTEVELLKNYYDADEYHQKYLIKNPQGYACPAHYVRDI
ncbi:hypothetical protein FOG48_03303 [Hanseniaspora uvarum]|nr:hypothetical protein FOG48_03303 [Hanseniaspora uvarum]